MQETHLGKVSLPWDGESGQCLNDWFLEGAGGKFLKKSLCIFLAQVVCSSQSRHPLYPADQPGLLGSHVVVSRGLDLAAQ